MSVYPLLTSSDHSVDVNSPETSVADGLLAEVKVTETLRPPIDGCARG